MRKSHSNIDLNDIEDDCYDLAFPNNNLHTPRQQSNSLSASSKHNTFRENQMFNSPIHKTFGISYVTPIIHPSLGFTPWTPVEDKQEKSNINPQFCIYQPLNFDQPIGNYEPERLNDQTPVKRKVNEQIFKTPANKSKRKQLPSTAKRTSRKRRETEMTDYVKTNELRSHRGLRNLSLSVKEVATKLGVATSKQIAETLIKELQEEKPTSQKEQQNIKRRVYDALKVLVSADILAKDNKNLIAHKAQEDRNQAKNERDALKQKIQAIKKSIQLKTQKALQINNKWVVREQLLQTNRKALGKDQDKIFFPFVAIQIDKDSFGCVEFSDENKQMTVSFKDSKLKMMGDLDVVLEMRVFEQQQKDKDPKVSGNVEEGTILEIKKPKSKTPKRK